MAQLIDGKLISQQIKDELKEEVAQFKAKGIDIDNDITTVPEAREAILALRNKLTESSRDKNV